MRLDLIKALWPEQKGFCIHRETTGIFYIFVHFLTDAEAFFNGEWHYAKKGSWIFWHSHSPQGVRKQDADLLHDWFHIADEDTESLLRHYGIETGRLYSPTDDSFITREIRDIELEFQKQRRFSAEITRNMIEILLAHLSRDLESKLPKESPHLFKRFCELRSEIMLRYNDPPSVTEMAERLYLSPSHFHKLYKDYFGISPAKDLQMARIEHAKLLLLQENISIADVAKRAGYQSVYHFIRQFKSALSITPGEYHFDAEKRK